MPERRLESEDIDSSLYRMRGMAMPHLLRVNMETGGYTPFAANISNRLSREMSLSSGTRTYIAVSFATAKRLKKLERVSGHSNSPCFGSFSKQVDMEIPVTGFAISIPTVSGHRVIRAKDLIHQQTSQATLKPANSLNSYQAMHRRNT